MLANHVDFGGGSFVYISGTGFNYYNVLNLQDVLTFSGMTALEWGGVPPGEYAVTTEALDPQNNVTRSGRFVYQVSETGDMLRTCIRFNLRVTVSIFGMWTIVVSHEGRELARLPIVVKQGVPD
jgi:hypothetical protein